jgi:hypothetical protein
MRIHYLLMLAVTAGYAATAELFVQGDRKVRHPNGECTYAPEDYTALAVAVCGSVLIGTSAWVARSARGRWTPATVVHAAVPAALGTLVGMRYYDLRLPHAAQCISLEFCTWCMDSGWASAWFEALVASAVAMPLGLVAGAVARRVIPDPEKECSYSYRGTE